MSCWTPVGRRGRSVFFFFNDTATTEIYTLSLHDALPIYVKVGGSNYNIVVLEVPDCRTHRDYVDRKSTRLNSSHSQISYAVFCLKKKKTSRPSPPAPRPPALRADRLSGGPLRPPTLSSRV